MKKNAPRRVQQKIDIESEPSRACLQASRKEQTSPFAESEIAAVAAVKSIACTIGEIER